MLYPLTFKPIFKEIIWGGAEILHFKGLPDESQKIGESWELSNVDQNFSVVANGPLAGKTIDKLIQEYGEQLLGTHVFKKTGLTFPLLIKFIDACDDLSIQVHPNNRIAKERHHSFGKTEMWYVVNASPDAFLYSGFSRPIDADEFVRHVEAGTITEVLNKFHVKAGDVFFLPAGRIHAIGSGCFITEIQQTSDLTYRIYDYNRHETEGKVRELHTELAKDAIDYVVYPNYQTSYHTVENEAAALVDCPYFTTNLLKINRSIRRDYASLDSFIVYICTKGKVVLKDNKSNALTVQQGQTILIPADTHSVTIEPEQPSELLETYIS